MEMGNRYGIDLGNILSTASALKTAKLKQNKMQREEDKAGAKKRNALAKIKRDNTVKGDDSLEMDEVAEPTSGAIVNEEDYKPDSVNDSGSTGEVEEPTAPQPKKKKNTNVLGQKTTMPELSEEEMQDYALDTESYEKMVQKVEGAKLIQRQYQQKLATLQMTMPNLTTEQRETMAQASINDFKQFVNMIDTADTKQKAEIQKQLDIKSRKLFAITELPAEGAARKDAYAQWRNEQILSVPPEQQAKVMKSIPEWDNENTMNWIGVKLAENADIFNTMNDITAKSVENERKVKAETTKHLRSKDEVLTEGDEDVTITPTKKGWKEKKRTESAGSIKEKIKKGGSGSAKPADYSLVERIATKNTTGIDTSTEAGKIAFAELSQERRDEITEISARASRIYKDGGGKITHAEAVQQASKEAKTKNAYKSKVDNPKKGYTRTSKSTGKTEVFNGKKWVKK